MSNSAFRKKRSSLTRQIRVVRSKVNSCWVIKSFFKFLHVESLYFHSLRQSQSTPPPLAWFHLSPVSRIYLLLLSLSCAEFEGRPLCPGKNEDLWVSLTPTRWGEETFIFGLKSLRAQCKKKARCLYIGHADALITEGGSSLVLPLEGTTLTGFFKLTFWKIYYVPLDGAGL